MNFTQLLMEAIFVGVGLTILGFLINYLYFKYIKKNMNQICREKFTNEPLIHILFISGFLFHLLCEITRVNQWYCKNGHACI